MFEFVKPFMETISESAWKTIRGYKLQFEQIMVTPYIGIHETVAHVSVKA
jgi:hypothetical protein